jgi:prevent-host-death family protein
MEMSVKAIRDNLTDAINRVADAGERVVVTRKNKGVAALVSMEDLALLQRVEDEADLKAARRARKEKGGITLDEYRKKHNL